MLVLRGFLDIVLISKRNLRWWWAISEGNLLVGIDRKVVFVVLIRDVVLDASKPCWRRDYVGGRSCDEVLIGDCRLWCKHRQEDCWSSCRWKLFAVDITLSEDWWSSCRWWYGKRCWSEIVDVDVNVVRIIDGLPMMAIRRLSGNDQALVQPNAFQYIL